MNTCVHLPHTLSNEKETNEDHNYLVLLLLSNEILTIPNEPTIKNAPKYPLKIPKNVTLHQNNSVN